MVCRRVGCVVWVFVALSGCAASSPPDAPVELGDAPPVMDAKPAADVSVMPTPDAAVRVDARLDAADAGAGPDAGTIVGSTQIAAVRQAAEGSIDLPVSGVKVTYLKPAVGDDAAGFFIQAEQVGPALFIQVDPQSLPGSVSVGDTVSFRAQSLKQNVNGILTVVTAVTSFAVTAQGGPGDVAALVQDVDGLNWDETIAASYESELIRVTGTLSEAFSISGGRHVQARVVPNGGTTTTAKIRVRMPDELRQAADVEIGCTIVLDASPLWLFKSGTNVTPQALAYQAGDLSLSGCPAPTVVKAYATALDTVQVMFSHQVDSATVNASKLTGGPSVSSAAVSGGNAHIVTVTLSQNAQAEMPYALTVAATVGDVHGKTLAAAAQAQFLGFTPMAQVIINEANPNLSSGSRDLIELLVTQEGNLFGMTLEQDITLATTWAAFPAVHVKKDDIVVVHTTPVPAGGQSETTQKNQFPRNAADYAENFDNAWDLMGT